MNFKEFKTGPDDNDRRLDRVVRKAFPEANLSSLYKSIRKGLVRVNDKKTTPEYRIVSGDVIKVSEILLSSTEQAASRSSGAASKNQNKSLSFDIVYKNEALLIINKPYGRTVHGDKSSLDFEVQDFYASLPESSSSLSFKPGPLHRLDKRTTGLLAFSWNLEGARWFSNAIQSHEIKKYYLGIVQGNFTQAEDWVDFIDKEETQSSGFKSVSISDKDSASLKCAVTHATPLWNGLYNGKSVTLVQYLIETGRTHQIRSQTAFHGYPLLGDTAYGGKAISGKTAHFLHAYRLEIPEDNPLALPLFITSPLPKAFKDFLKSCNCEIGRLSL